MTLTRRVKCLWALPLYTFNTTLVLLVMRGLGLSQHYKLVDNVMSAGAGGLMLLVGAGLIQLLRQGRREYGKLTLIYWFMIVSQVVVALITGKVEPHIYNALAVWSWPVFILWLAYECKWIPWLRFSFAEVAYLMSKDLGG